MSNLLNRLKHNTRNRPKLKNVTLKKTLKICTKIELLITIKQILKSV